MWVGEKDRSRETGGVRRKVRRGVNRKGEKKMGRRGDKKWEEEVRGGERRKR